MKFELVDFYPISKKMPQKNKNLVGTVHIYSIDNNMDFRGIKVIKRSKTLIFFLPNQWAFDEETGKKVSFPVYSFTNQDNHKDMMNFLHEVVKPLIFEKIKDQK